jgi:copper chaperone CopZ
METIHHITLLVEEIPCSGCAMDIEFILLGMDGIVDAAASMRKNTVKILYDPSEIEKKQIINKVRRLGLKTSQID